MIALRNTWFLLLVLMVGCSSFVKPDTLEQRLMYAQSQVGAAYKTVADLRGRDAISKEDGKKAIEQIDSADKAIKLARGALGQAKGQIRSGIWWYWPITTSPNRARR
jgi:hypothetical protein